MIKKAAFYIRVSTLYQIDKDSLPLQREDLINYAKYVFNITDYEIFEDAGYSGKNTDRPAFQNMMERIRNGEFTHLMVWKIDRISRNLLDFASMYDELKSLNITFISKNEQFDTSTAMGEAMLKIILVFAELERNMTSERVSAVMISRAEKGLWNGANVPLGYKWSKEKAFPVIDAEEALIVHQLFDCYEEKQSSLFTSRWLNDNKIKTKRGGHWNSASICNILKNPFYKGTLRYNYRSSARGKIKDESEWIIVENNHPALIDAAQWDRVQVLLNDNQKNIGKVGQKKRIKHTHLFAGIMRCVCGAAGGATLDRPRANGWRPSRYLCTRVSSGNRLCNNKQMVSDIIAGPFTFNYIQNMLKIQNKVTACDSQTDLEKALLNGSTFKNVIGIEKNSLQEIYDSFTITENIDYPLSQKKSAANDTDTQIKNYITERNRHQKAFERLKNLYLYDDTAFSEKDFISEKQRIMKLIDDVNIKLSNLKTTADSMEFSGIEFLQEASNFVISQQLLSNQNFDNWPDFASCIDIDILHNFLCSIIEKIVYKNGKIISIEFKNKIIHKFLYNE